MQELLTITLEVIVLIYTIAFILQTVREFSAVKNNSVSPIVKNEVQTNTKLVIAKPCQAVKPSKAKLPSITNITLKQLREIANKDEAQRSRIESFLEGRKYYRVKKDDLYRAIAQAI